MTQTNRTEPNKSRKGLRLRILNTERNRPISSKAYTITITTEEGTFTSRFAVGDWVRYADRLIGKVLAIAYQEEVPVMTEHYSSWTGEWFPAGFRYRLQFSDDFESFDEVEERHIVSKLSDDEIEQLDRLWWLRLDATQIDAKIAEFRRRYPGVAPKPSLIPSARIGYWSTST